jgi:hypothetical protein
MTDKVKTFKPFSSLSLLVILFVFLFNFNNGHRWKSLNVITWDVNEYYNYLPAAFIHHDLSFSFIRQLPKPQRKQYEVLDTGSGPAMNIKTIGMAVSYAPFFAIANISARKHGFPQDGFSEPYQFWVSFSGLFYGLLGLVILARILLWYWPDLVVAITILCLALGTNLYYYSSCEGGMSHAFCFCMFTCFLYGTLKWHQAFRFRHLLILGLSLALAVLARPTEILAVIIFLCYGVKDLGSFGNKLALLRRHYLQLITVTGIVLLLFVPQLMYWKIYSGHWFFYGFGEQHFFFNHPHILKGLFSYRKGWFVYTPVMLLSIAGLFLLKRYNSDFLIPLLLFLVFNLFVVFSWWCWWYGGSFGMRALIESYVFLSFPLAAAFDYAFKRIASTIMIMIIAIACITLNLFQTWQYRNGIIHWDSMTRQSYWAVFGKDHYVVGEDKLLLAPDYDKSLKTGQE